MSPMDTTCEKPMLRALAQSIMPVMRAPDCDKKAMSPARARRCSKAGVEPEMRQHQPHAIGTLDAQDVRPRSVENRLFHFIAYRCTWDYKPDRPLEPFLREILRNVHPTLPALMLAPIKATEGETVH